MSVLAPKLAALLLAVALAWAGLAETKRAAAEDYSDAVLEAFASATIEASRRIESWRPLIEGAADDDEREDLREKAEADVALVIRETDGISEDEYYAIYEAAREDEALHRRIDEILSAYLQRPLVPRAE